MLSKPHGVQVALLGLMVPAFLTAGCGSLLGNNRKASDNSLNLAGPNGYPYCTNGSNTGSGYGWDTSVTDPNGSHSCLVPVAKGPNGYPYCTNGSNTGSGYGWDTNVIDPKGTHSCLVPTATPAPAPAPTPAPKPAPTPTPAPTPAPAPAPAPAPTPSNTACTVPTSVLSTQPSPGTTTQFAAAGSLSQLPALSVQATTVQLKQYVATVYSIFPAFAQVYEQTLGMTKNQALAFMYADMSRESAQGHAWRIDLETGQGGPGDAWGPFQAAVTNFNGGGYDSSIEDYTGLPVPSMSQFYDPAVSTYAGMKRLADGILNSLKTFGPGAPASRYLLGSLADHNTGWVTSANDPNWLSSYGNETLRLMLGYSAGNNLTNTAVFWTGEAASDFCAQ